MLWPRLVAWRRAGREGAETTFPARPSTRNPANEPDAMQSSSKLSHCASTTRMAAIPGGKKSQNDGNAFSPKLMASSFLNGATNASGKGGLVRMGHGRSVAIGARGTQPSSVGRAVFDTQAAGPPYGELRLPILVDCVVVKDISS